MKFKPLVIAVISLIVLSNLLLADISSRQPIPIEPLPAKLFQPVIISENRKEDIADLVPTIIPITPAPTRELIPVPTPRLVVKDTKPKTIVPKVNKIVTTSGFRLDRNVSWYGPGFYGHRTACGFAYTKTILGVANKTLPCGTKVTFMWKGKSITVPVIDRGPYVAGRQWDLSGGLCVALHHCFTGSIYYRIGK